MTKRHLQRDSAIFFALSALLSIFFLSVCRARHSFPPPSVPLQWRPAGLGRAGQGLARRGGWNVGPMAGLWRGPRRAQPGHRGHSSGQAGGPLLFHSAPPCSYPFLPKHSPTLPRGLRALRVLAPGSRTLVASRSAVVEAVEAVYAATILIDKLARRSIADSGKAAEPWAEHREPYAMPGHARPCLRAVRRNRVRPGRTYWGAATTTTQIAGVPRLDSRSREGPGPGVGPGGAGRGSQIRQQNRRITRRSANKLPSAVP